MATSYVYSNTHAEASAQHNRLSTILDEDTLAGLSGLRVALSGADILEVGCGGGSIARRLAEQVGPGGRVLATDIEPRPIAEHPQLQVLKHDITTGVPAGPWTVIHARLVLMHLREREVVLRALAAALAPGGALMVEDWDQTWLTGRVLHAPTPAQAQLWTWFNDALIKTFTKAGVDPSWASRALPTMLDAGLIDVDATVRCRSWPGGTAGALLSVSSIQQLRDRLHAEGLTDDDLTQISELMHDPRMVIRQYPLVQTIGYRPAA